MPARSRPLTPAEAVAAGRRAIAEKRRKLAAARHAADITAAELRGAEQAVVALAEPDTPPTAAAPEKPARLWTAERDEALRRMWIDEGLTQRAIAAVLTGEVGRPVSRNAIAKRILQKRWTGLGAAQGFRRVGVTLGGGAPEKAGKLSAVLEALPTGERRPEPACVPETASQHPPGAWPIADLREGQCRFACTPDDAPSHRFCGAPTCVGRGNLHGSWCAAHLPVVWGRGTESERAAGGVLRRLG